VGVVCEEAKNLNDDEEVDDGDDDVEDD